jgi:hypothetical protein
MPRVLIYKQTHPDDPGDTGVFGIHDCMKSVREQNFDAVIALLSNCVSWVGLNARKVRCPGYCDQVIFKHFLPVLPTRCYPAPPTLLKFMNGNRFEGHKRHIVYPLPQGNGSRLIVEIKIILEEAVQAPPSRERGGKVRGPCPPKSDDKEM